MRMHACSILVVKDEGRTTLHVPRSMYLSIRFF